jgi:hypothetical protein
MSADLNSSEFLKALSEPNKDATKLVDIVNSVFKASASNIIPREVSVLKKIKVKHNAIRDAVLSFRDLVLHFNNEGIAETEEYNKPIIEIEQMYRPGCFSFVEDEVVVIEEDITVDEFLEKARNELQEDENNSVEDSIKELEDILNTTLLGDRKEEQVLPEESNTEILEESEEEITKDQNPKKRGRKAK